MFIYHNSTNAKIMHVSHVTNERYIEVAYKQHLLMNLFLDVFSPFNSVYTLFCCVFLFVLKRFQKV